MVSSKILLVLACLISLLSVVCGKDKTPNFGELGCSGCSEPGHFCGIDGNCHIFSCQNYYQYADRKLTGYADNTTFQCFGYTQGDQENAHGVIYGCDPLYPLVKMTPGKQVTEPFNRKCSAEREGGYLFECYEFQPSETATDFTFFEREAESSFPDCKGGKQPKYYYIIASSNHYVGFEGLQGNPIVAGGADIDGDTLWQVNEMRSFKRDIAMMSMYANVVGGPSPPSQVKPIQAGSIGKNPLRNQRPGNHGGPPENAATLSFSGRNAALALGFGTLLQWLLL
ncbi:expressed unknown protein [Seminavis robusta]|uniref:Uncharacterized protein n=1 Tax=Seminavis robusta TaxID=568900 RepID=A0A9N8EUX1_9STRA|nr:expressed unknown protein [Seminavis robusta]|eukprot:Sro2024_g311600.1 n/a (283) ;mRNA; f:13183-14031